MLTLLDTDCNGVLWLSEGDARGGNDRDEHGIDGEGGRSGGNTERCDEAWGNNGSFSFSQSVTSESVNNCYKINIDIVTIAILKM